MMKPANLAPVGNAVQTDTPLSARAMERHSEAKKENGPRSSPLSRCNQTAALRPAQEGGLPFLLAKSFT